LRTANFVWLLFFLLPRFSPVSKYHFIGSIKSHLSAVYEAMNERIHELRAEIKTIDEMLDSLSGPMHELALEEQRNLKFELELLQRNTRKQEHSEISLQPQS
jgi:predicted nuclease with TOPRIM domain